MRFEIVPAQKAGYPVRGLCSVITVSTPGFYAWYKRAKNQRALSDDTFSSAIKTIFATSREAYGSPHIYAECKAFGRTISESVIARIMQENGLTGLPRCLWRCITTKAGPSNTVRGNALNQDFSGSSINEKWGADVNFIPTDEGRLYLAQ